MGQVELYLGDCLDVMSKLADHSVDAIICDLPYGTTACAWDSVIPFAPLWAHYKRIIKPRGAIVLFGAQPFTSALIMSNAEWFKWSIVWQKTRPTGHLNALIMPLRQHEDISVFGNGKITYNPQLEKKPLQNRRKRTGEKNSSLSHCYNGFTKLHIDDNDTAYPRSVIEFDNPNHGETGLHPTQKPVDLLAYLIRTYTNEGETVLDNCMGSGTAGVAAMQTGRKFVGIELKSEYFDIAVRRITDARRAAEGLPKQLRGAVADYADAPLFAEVSE